MNVADITAELDDYGFSDTSSTRKMAKVNATVWDICSRLPWSFLEKEITLTFDGTNPYALNWPSDFKAAVLMVDPASGGTITWERWDTINRVYGNAMTTAGTPSFYYFVAKKAQFYPVPGSSQTIKMLYLRRHPTLLAADLEASILIPADHHDAIVYGALYKLYTMEDDPELSAVLKAEYDEKIAKMTEDVERTQYQSADRIFAVDPEDIDSYPY